MEILKRKFQIGFVLILSLLFIQCSEIDELLAMDDDSEDFKLEAPHTYDIKLTNGDDIIHYAGTVPEDKTGFTVAVENNVEQLKGYKTISLFIVTDDVTITGMLVLDKNDKPYSLNPNAAKEVEKSALSVLDSNNSLTASSASGNVLLKNFKSQKVLSFENGYLVSYTLEIDGVFLVNKPEFDEAVPYTVTGKIVMNPYKK